MSSDLSKDGRNDARIERLRSVLQLLETEPLAKGGATPRGKARSKGEHKVPSEIDHKPGDIHSLREARNHLSAIVDRALKGSPQAIRKRGVGAVVVISVEVAQALVEEIAKPKSLAEMFPVDESNPPVSPLKLTRPGKTKGIS